MSEADVRAEVLDPLIARLGYRFGEPHYVERERHLRYPYTFLGHKGPKDVPLGSADYVCGVDGRRGSFVVEAKRGDKRLDLDDIEQAHSYAAHPEIRADFFVLSNGHEVCVYETIRAIADEPLLAIDNANLEERYHELAALLEPSQLVKNCTRTYDLTLPLAPGLGSSIKFAMGWIRTARSEAYLDAPPNHPARILLSQSGLMEKMRADLEEVRQFRQPIEGGTLSRGEDGRVVADVRFGSASEKLDHNLAAMNLKRIAFYSNAPDVPLGEKVLFETLRKDSVPQGTDFYSGMRGELAKTGAQIDFQMHYRVLGSLTEVAFQGEYFGTTIMTGKVPLIEMPPIVLIHEGEFEIGL